MKLGILAINFDMCYRKDVMKWESTKFVFYGKSIGKC